MAKQDKPLAQVFHFDLQGKREEKYDFLNQNSIASIPWNKLKPNEPNYFLVKKNFENAKDFESYIDLRLLFIENSMGIATGNDDELVAFDKSLIEKKYLVATQFYYRPFDVRFTIFDNQILQRARYKLMSNYIRGKNLGLNVVRQSKQKGIEVLVSDNLSNRDFVTNHTFNFPLYLYPETTVQQSVGASTSSTPGGRIPNLNAEIVKQIAAKLGLVYSPNPKDIQQSGKDILLNITKDNPNFFVPKSNHSLLHPIDLLDYIYAVLHSPTYREKYKEFLKIDFPRVPFPRRDTINGVSTDGVSTDGLSTFWQLVKLGGELRQIHLLESPIVERFITQYPIDGDNVVTKPNYQNGKVYINATQYFDNVPEIAWNFYIGGYQPAQKWLKDRKDRTLEFDDILHYQKIIVALTETDRLMKEIDQIEIE